MAILAENRRPRLKVMLRGQKFNLILNVIGVRLRFIETHFNHNGYNQNFHFFGFFYRSLWSHAKVSDPPVQGGNRFLFSLIIILICC